MRGKCESVKLGCLYNWWWSYRSWGFCSLFIKKIRIHMMCWWVWYWLEDLNQYIYIWLGLNFVYTYMCSSKFWWWMILWCLGKWEWLVWTVWFLILGYPMNMSNSLIITFVDMVQIVECMCGYIRLRHVISGSVLWVMLRHVDICFCILENCIGCLVCGNLFWGHKPGYWTLLI